MRIQYKVLLLLCGVLFYCCKPGNTEVTQGASTTDSVSIIKPVFVTDTVVYDSDDPAFWINAADPTNSLILGTDKGGDTGDGALFVFNLQGKIIADKTIRNIKRPNNVDVAYGLTIKGVKHDIAVLTERNTNSIRVIALPEMKFLDGGGIPVFEGDSLRAPMGVALYTSTAGEIHAIVSRKTGPNGSYLAQYKLHSDASGVVRGTLLRKFGQYSGKNEIESIAVDNELGYVYYSDEGAGIRKYYAHPDSTTNELAFFGTTGFTDNHEGISIYKHADGTGYILVSDQQANMFRVFPRAGTASGAHDHPLLKVIHTATSESDGSEVTSFSLPGFPNGLFVAMSDDKTFQFYNWKDLAGDELK